MIVIAARDRKWDFGFGDLIGNTDDLQQIDRLLKSIFRNFVDRGGTVLMSTHTLEVAEAMCDRIAIIQEGVIVAQGTMDELREQTAAGSVSLEELFLKLTGGDAVRELAAVLGQ